MTNKLPSPPDTADKFIRLHQFPVTLEDNIYKVWGEKLEAYVTPLLVEHLKREGLEYSPDCFEKVKSLIIGRLTKL